MTTDLQQHSTPARENPPSIRLEKIIREPFTDPSWRLIIDETVIVPLTTRQLFSATLCWRKVAMALQRSPPVPTTREAHRRWASELLSCCVETTE